MISASDVDYHPSPDNNPDWAETNFFPFMIPEHNLTGSLYFVGRTSLGVCITDVLIFNRLSFDRQDCLYIDSRQHVPLPPKLSDFTTASGLSVRAHSLRSYDVSCDHPQLLIDLHYEAIMDPYDINDPDIDPLARRQGDAKLNFFGGHFDMSARVTGSVTLKGETLPVDCVDTMDHSWGVRPQVESTSACWIHAHFGEDVLHGSFLLDTTVRAEDQFTLYRGYLLRDGVVSGLVRSRLVAYRLDSVAMTLEWEAEDELGRVVRTQGGAIAFTTVPWYPYSKSFYTTYRWTNSLGQVGHGCMQEAHNLDKLCLLNRL